jgi:hypothetical protein
MRFRAAVAIFAVAVLLFAACGDDDDNSASNGDTNTTSDAGDSGNGDSGDGSNDGFIFSSSECAQLATALVAGYTAAFSGASSELTDLQDKLQEFRENAPDEIADDVDTVADAYSDFAAAADDAGLDLSDPSTFSDPAKATELAEFSQQVDEIFNDDVQAAVDRVDEYLQANCGS